MQPPYPQPPPKPQPSRRGCGPFPWLLLILGGLVGCVVLPCAAIGGGVAYARSRPTPTPVVARFSPDRGSAAIFTSRWGLTVTEVETTSTLPGVAGGSARTAVGQWLLVTLSLTNAGLASSRVNAWDFEARDSAGNTYQHATDPAALAYPGSQGAQVAGARQLPPGTAVDLVLVFDIGPEAKGLQLVFKQGDRPRFDLGR
jgi:hypothetical protein